MKIQPHWVVTPGKQTTTNNIIARELRKLQSVNISPAVKKESTAQVAMSQSNG
jgi:hypothetical protein